MSDDMYEHIAFPGFEFRTPAQIAPALVGMDASRQNEIDECMLNLGGPGAKQRLGGNATAAVSAAAPPQTLTGTSWAAAPSQVMAMRRRTPGSRASIRTMSFGWKYRPADQSKSDPLIVTGSPTDENRCDHSTPAIRPKRSEMDCQAETRIAGTKMLDQLSPSPSGLMLV